MDIAGDTAVARLESCARRSPAAPAIAAAARGHHAGRGVEDLLRRRGLADNRDGGQRVFGENRVQEAMPNGPICAPAPPS